MERRTEKRRVTFKRFAFLSILGSVSCSSPVDSSLLFLRVDQPNLAIDQLDSVQVRYRVLASNGSQVDDAPVTFESQDPLGLRVSEAGMIVSVGPPRRRASVTVNLGDRVDTVFVQVRQVPSALELSISTLTIMEATETELRGRLLVAQGNLSIRARDMAKIGQVYLDGGRWADEQIVPESWVEMSIMPRYPVPWAGYDSYGYGWYTHTLAIGERNFSYYLASGNGGNKIYVLPDEQMVVVIQSGAYNTSYGQGRSLDVLKLVLTALPPR